MQIFHRGGAENNEKSHPQRRTLKRDRFVVLAFLFFVLVSFENDGVQEQREQAKTKMSLMQRIQRYLG